MQNLVDLKIPTPEGDEAATAMTAAQYAGTFTIATGGDSLKAQEARARINAKIRTLNDARMALTRPIDAAKKTIMDFFSAPIATLEGARAVLDRKIIAYDDEQERIRKEEQRKVEAKAAAERQRLQAIADEAARKAREEAAAKRKAADEAAAAGRAEEAAKLAAQAQRIDDKGAEKAEKFEERAAAVVAPIVAADTVKAAGTSFRSTWGFRVADTAKVRLEFKTDDLVKIGKLVRSLGPDAAAIVGGIEVFPERGLSSRRA